MTAPIHRWLLALTLGLVGLLANAFPLPLFFRVDFLFGSVATILATIWLGWRAGLLATVIAGSYTVHLWGHPYALLIMLAETVFVGLLLRKGGRDVILCDAAYWLLLGMPLVLATYGWIMGMDRPATLLILFKQPVNGILNAFFAMVLSRALPAPASVARAKGNPTLQQWLSAPVAGLVMLPAVLLTVFESRTEINRIESLVGQRLQLFLRNTTDHVAYVYERRLVALENIARFAVAGDGRMTAKADLEERQRVLLEVFPDFEALSVIDANGRIIASSRVATEFTDPEVGLPAVTAAQLSELRRSPRRIISPVAAASGSAATAVQSLLVPIIAGGELLGVAAGNYRLSSLTDWLLRETRGTDVELMLIDAQHRIIASTGPERRTLSKANFDWHELQPTTVAGLSVLPTSASVPSMLRYQRSSYFAHLQLTEPAGLRVIASVPIGPYQSELYDAYIDNLAFALFVSCALFLLAQLVIRRLARPVVRLAEITLDASDQLVRGDPVAWPSSPIREIDVLIDHMKSMGAALARMFFEERRNAERLAAANAELEKEIATRRASEAALRKTESFLREQNRVLLDLSRHRGGGARDLALALQHITEAAARILGVDRASIWFFDEHRTKIICHDLFVTSAGRHEAGPELLAERYPAYFSALNDQRVIAAGDAHHDHRTAEFTADYLRPVGIGAMLDAPVWVRGRMVGVVCHEYVGPARTWSTEEEVFAGAIADVVALALEEHERAIAQKALAESEERYRRIVDTAREGIWVVDQDYRTSYVNSRMAELLGYEPSEILGRTVAEFVFPEDRATLDALRRERARGIPGHYDFRYRRKDGRELWVLSSTSPILGPGGKFIGALGMFTDITERRDAERERALALQREREARAALLEAQQKLQQHAHELEQRVNERTAELQDMVAQMEAFSYTVSHDLRAPLRALTGYAEALQEDFGARMEPQARHYVSRLAAGAQRLDRLIQDVLTYSRVARAELALRPVDLERLVADVIADYPALQSTGVNLTVERPLPPVVGNPALLTQCVSNLLGNAVKFSRDVPDPRVRVRTESRNGNVRLWIEDNGIGIDPRYHHKIFGIFERLVSDREFEGTGIGLAIVQKAIDRMGGRVGVESEPGTGSRFWIELPHAQ